MRVIQNKEEMISYYQLKKFGKKVGNPKIRSNLSKMRKFGKKIGIICILIQKKYIKHYKMSVIQNENNMISNYRLTMNQEKQQGRHKILIKVVKNKKN